MIPIIKQRYPQTTLAIFTKIEHIDDVLLQRLLLMVAENKVKVFSAPVIPIDMQQTDEKIKEHLSIYIGDEATKPDSKKFFRVLHENNICFKIFFTSLSFFF
jgi:hypothetical protein